MENKNEYYNKQNNKVENLSLNTIMVLKIGTENNYMVTMLERNCEDRILLNNGEKEITIIEKCLQNNLELERKSIINYMPTDYIEIYNEALRIGRYDACLIMLKGIESHMNQMTKERNKILKKK